MRRTRKTRGIPGPDEHIDTLCELLTHLRTYLTDAAERNDATTRTNKKKAPQLLPAKELRRRMRAPFSALRVVYACSR